MGARSGPRTVARSRWRIRPPRIKRPRVPDRCRHRRGPCDPRRHRCMAPDPGPQAGGYSLSSPPTTTPGSCCRSRCGVRFAPRVSPAGGRDGFVFASLTPFFFRLSPAGRDASASELRGGRGMAAWVLNPLCFVASLLASLPQAGETVLCSLRSLLFSFFRLSPAGRDASASELRGGAGWRLGF